MEWYWILLLVLAGIVALFLLVGYGVAIGAALIITKLKGSKIRPNYEQMRAINIKMGHVDFDAYDQMEKEAFTLHRDGAELACEFIPAPSAPPGQPAKCLIRVHGFGVNKITSVRYVQILRKLGYAAVIYDQRSFGNSSGVCSLGYYERQDLVAITDWVRQRLGEDTIIGLHGESLGAITILEGLGIIPDIAFAISDSCSTSVYNNFTAITHLPAFPFLSTLNLLAKLIYKFDLTAVRPIDRVAESDVPILFIHGTKDKPMPYTESEKLFAVAKNPLSHLEIFEGVWHTGGHMVETERYEKLVLDFVRAAEEAALQGQKQPQI